MSRAKYDSFAETPIGKKPGKRYPWAEEEYVGITCPECNTMFVEITVQSVKTSKASNCLKHLRENPSCQAAVYHNVGEAPEKKRKYTNEDVMKAVAESEARLRQEMRAMETRIITTVSTTTNLGPPPPTTQDELYEKLEEREKMVTEDKVLLRTINSNTQVCDQPSRCVVCLEEEATNVVTLPCAHRVMCWGCWERVQAVALASGDDPKCPACKEVVQKALCVSTLN